MTTYTPTFYDALGPIDLLSAALTKVSYGALPTNMTTGDGHTAIFGAGNSTLNYAFNTDYLTGTTYGMTGHYRTGDYVTPTQVNFGLLNLEKGFVYNMDAGYQNGLHNEQGIRTDRAGASFDIALHSNNGFTNGQFELIADGPNGQHRDLLLTDHKVGLTDNWTLDDAVTHNVVLGLTMSADGKTLEDSMNFAFLKFDHGPAGTGDIKAGDYHVNLIENAHVPFIGLVHIGSVNTDFHLT